MKILWTKSPFSERPDGTHEDIQESIARLWIDLGYCEEVASSKSDGDVGKGALHSAIEGAPEDRAIKGAAARRGK